MKDNPAEGLDPGQVDRIEGNPQDVAPIFKHVVQMTRSINAYKYGEWRELDELLCGLLYVSRTLNAVGASHNEVFGENSATNLKKVFELVENYFTNDFRTLQGFIDALENN